MFTTTSGGGGGGGGGGSNSGVTNIVVLAIVLTTAYLLLGCWCDRCTKERTNIRQTNQSGIVLDRSLAPRELEPNAFAQQEYRRYWGYRHSPSGIKDVEYHLKPYSCGLVMGKMWITADSAEFRVEGLWNVGGTGDGWEEILVAPLDRGIARRTTVVVRTEDSPNFASLYATYKTSQGEKGFMSLFSSQSSPATAESSSPGAPDSSKASTSSMPPSSTEAPRPSIIPLSIEASKSSANFEPSLEKDPK